jgi:hypothetical protein
MLHTCFVVTFATSAILIGQLGVQSPPDFSGTWVLASSGTFPPEQRLTITQDASTMSIDGTAYLVRGSHDGIRSTFSETPYPTRTTLRLDGLEHSREVIENRPPEPMSAPSARAMRSTTEEAIYKATWAGRQLIVMRYEKGRITAPSLTPSVVIVRRTVREALELLADGSLVWETLTVSDPLPWNRPSTSPTAFQKIYKRSLP